MAQCPSQEAKIKKSLQRSTKAPMRHLRSAKTVSNSSLTLQTITQALEAQHFTTAKTINRILLKTAATATTNSQKRQKRLDFSQVTLGIKINTNSSSSTSKIQQIGSPCYSSKQMIEKILLLTMSLSIKTQWLKDRAPLI